MTQVASAPPRQKRKQPTPRQVLIMVMRQVMTSPAGYPTLICAYCGNPIQEVDYPTVIREHLHALALGGDDSPANQGFVHGACANRKTTGKAGTSRHSSDGSGDIARIAKLARIRGETCTGPKAKIVSRGFDKTLRKKMSGEVVKR